MTNVLFGYKKTHDFDPKSLDFGAFSGKNRMKIL